MIPWAAAAIFSVLWSGVLGWLMLDAGCRGARALGIRGPSSLRLLAGIVLAAAWLWLWMLLLASVGGLGPRSTSVGIVAAFASLRAYDPAPGAIPTARALALLFGRSRRGQLARLASWSLLFTLGGLLLQALERPAFEFDALSYHLPFTAQVLDTGSIPHVDTPFGDPAAAYQPKTEHVLRSLLAPLPGHERLVWIGSFPHLFLLWLGVYVAARSLGAARTGALWGAASTLLATVTLSQAADSLVDLATASWWIAFAALLLAWQRDSRATPDAAGAPLAGIAGLALGLSLGAKYLAVTLAPLLLLVLGPALLRRRSLRAWSLFGAGALATGGFFYLRNALWTGNPLYPIEIELFGWPLFDGPISRAAMYDWVFNQSRADAGPLGVRLASFVGPLVGNARPDDLPQLERTTALLGAVPLLLWLWGSSQSYRDPARIGIAALAPATLALAWAVIPFTYGRFALVAIGSVGVMAALAAARRPAVVAATIALGVGLQAALIPDRWHALVLSAGLVAAAITLALGWLPPVRRAVVWRTAGTASALWILFVAASESPQIVSTTPAEWRPGLRVLERLPRDTRIAYAGNNVPYVFRGNVGHRVQHIPIDGELAGRFDTRAARWRTAGHPPAVSASPGLDRGVQRPDAWLEAIRAARIDRLVVTRLGGTQLVQIRHDRRGFPVEEEWARAAGPTLELLHSDDVMSLYAVHRDRPAASSLPAARQRREPDAFALLSHPRALERHYPLALEELALPQYARTRARARADRER